LFLDDLEPLQEGPSQTLYALNQRRTAAALLLTKLHFVAASSPLPLRYRALLLPLRFLYVHKEQVRPLESACVEDGFGMPDTRFGHQKNQTAEGGALEQ
jgi:hypothetical protein